jgi:hypothetical protein
MTRRRIAWFTSAVCSLAVLYGLALRAEPPKTVAQSDAPFSGKIVILSSRSTKHGGMLEDPRIKRIGEQVFVVGKGIYLDEGSEWYNGRTVWVALNEVAQIVELPSRDELRKAIDSRRKAQSD